MHPEVISSPQRVRDVNVFKDLTVFKCLHGMVSDFKPLQPSKADQPIEVTLFGIEREVKPLQPSKACQPIEVTLLGISIEVKPLQPLKA